MKAWPARSETTANYRQNRRARFGCTKGVMRTTSAWTPRSGAHPHRRGDRTEGKHRAAARSSRASRRCVALGRRLVERVGREHESDGDRTRDDVDAQRFDVRAARAVTWLILPVVICLSQRLSHACLSISDLIR